MEPASVFEVGSFFVWPESLTKTQSHPPPHSRGPPWPPVSPKSGHRGPQLRARTSYPRFTKPPAQFVETRRMASFPADPFAVPRGRSVSSDAARSRRGLPHLHIPIPHASADRPKDRLLKSRIFLAALRFTKIYPILRVFYIDFIVNTQNLHAAGRNRFRYSLPWERRCGKRAGWFRNPSRRRRNRSRSRGWPG